MWFSRVAIATRENTTFGVHSVKIQVLVFMSEINFDPTLKKSSFLLLLCFYSQYINLNMYLLFVGKLLFLLVISRNSVLFCVFRDIIFIRSYFSKKKKKKKVGPNSEY